MTFAIATCLTVGIVGLVPWMICAVAHEDKSPLTGANLGFAIGVLVGCAMFSGGFAGALIAWIWSAVP